MLNLLLFPTTKNNYSPYLLRDFALFVYTIIFAFVNVAPGFFPANFKSFTTPVLASNITSDRLIELTNEDRRRYQLSDLKPNLNLTASAYAKAHDMIDKQYWDHFGPNGEAPWDFIKASGYNYIYAGENLAKGFQTAEGVHQAWMASPTHKANILSGNYKDIGIAVVEGNLLGQDVVLVVQMFGNLTTEVQQTPATAGIVDSVNLEESGDIKSIKITVPADGSIINNSTINIEGNVTGIKGEYQVILSDEEDTLGNVKSSVDKWKFELSKDWTQGEHTVEAIINIDGKLLSDESKFIVDSKAPHIIEESIKVEERDKGWDIFLLPDDINSSIMLVSGSVNKQFTKRDNSEFYVYISDNEKSDSVKVVMTDKQGNISEYDISDRFEISDETNFLGSVSGFTGMFNSFSPRDFVNIGLSLFILTLLIIEIYQYKKLGKFTERLHSVFIIGIWLLLIIFSTVIGFKGSITYFASSI